VLDVLVEKGDWASRCPGAKGRGVAIHESYDSIVGMIAEVAVANGEVKVGADALVCGQRIRVGPSRDIAPRGVTLRNLFRTDYFISR
jgi:isoquinoline 1-oxidoreductase beta subunit